MNCPGVQDKLEEYIMSDLIPSISEDIKNHLDSCLLCQGKYNEALTLISNLRSLDHYINLKKSVIFQKPDQSISKAKSKLGKFQYRLLALIASVSFLMLLFTSTFLAFPALAEKYAPGLPIVQDISNLKGQVEGLKIEVKKIKDTEIKVVQTQESALDTQDNQYVQGLALEFVKAQYKGDLTKIKNLATNDFYSQILKNRQEYIFSNKGQVVFGSISNTNKEKDLFVIYIRISDSTRDDATEYQEDIYIEKIGDSYKINNVLYDA
jgi:hypothetical protein